MYGFLPERDRKLLEEARKNKGFLMHNYTREEHLSFVLERLGGEERIKKAYPAVCRVVLNAKRRDAARRRQGEPEEYAIGNIDKMTIERVRHDGKKMITMECHANFVNEKPIVSIQTELYNCESGKFLTGSDSEEQNIFRMNTKDSHDISLFIDRKRDLSLLSVAHFFYTEEDEYGDPYLASATEVRDEVKILADDLVEEFQVLGPIIGKRKPTQRDYVQVVYNREATVKEDYDYNSLKSIRDNKLPIELPVGARVKVNQFHQIDGFYEDFGAQLYLEDLSEGTTEYYGEPVDCQHFFRQLF